MVSWIYSIFRLSSFEDRERTKAKREAAHNNFEALVYDVTDKLEQSEFQVFIGFSILKTLIADVCSLSRFIEKYWFVALFATGHRKAIGGGVEGVH